MVVKTEYQAVVICDICGDCETFAWILQKEAIKEARRMGWSIGKVTKCPKCRAIKE